MKQINIIGMGMSAKTVTGEALELIQDADVLIGAKRLINEFSYLEKPSHNAFLSQEIADLISGSDAEKIAILVSGDVGFYSGAEKLVDALAEYDPTLIPGISSVSYFFAKCRIPWKEANLISCHGIETNLVSSVRRNRYTFALTGRNIPDIQNQLAEYGYGDLKVWVGENLGLEGELVTSCMVSELNSKEYSSLTVLIIENPDFDKAVKTGIPDDEFIRAKVPMTKSEVRAVCMSKLGLSPSDTAYDIGCGTGSVSMEMAFAAYEGRVFAFDKNEEAIRLVEENARKFHLDNIEAVCGLAPECLEGLPIPDVAFIGGSSGNMSEIVEFLHEKNSRMRFVITAVTIETAMAALESLENVGIDGDIVQVAVSKGRKIADYHMLTAQNPIFIIYGGGMDE